MAFGGAQNLARSPELLPKLLWTLGLLCAYRIGVHIPVPGVDGAALNSFFESVAGTLFGLLSPNGSAGGTVVALLLTLTGLGGLLRNRRRRMDGK